MTLLALFIIGIELFVVGYLWGQYKEKQKNLKDLRIINDRIREMTEEINDPRVREGLKSNREAYQIN